MERDKVYRNPELIAGYHGDMGSPVPERGPPVRTEGLDAGENRGRRAPQEGSGVVIGSGAGAGGGGSAEDYDSDPASGDGAVRPKEKRPPGARP